ncbi:MAG TPA: hypothetical protein VKG26_07300 [Bacteroidia bacterium]|nr:hypothetical protein [Bacteroidia bacterium]
MKKTIYILTITIGLLSCNNQSKQVDKTSKVDNPGTVTQTKKIDNSKYYTQQDTILVTNELGDSAKFDKVNFNNIIDKHPEFFEEYPDNPDQAYFKGNDDKKEFGSEIGQDNYYILYAYFLKQRNGVKEFAEQRRKLIDIYTNINSLFGHFEYGGTYFGHQCSRILGYAEYSIYLMPKNKEDIIKNYDITRQKELYIKSLRQLIEDESKIDLNTIEQEKTKRNKELTEIVDKLDKLITGIFYLRRAQEFQYEHYEYY